MTKEITKAFILGELQNKFGLREFAKTPFTFSEEVLPTYEIGSHLRKRTVLMTEKSVTTTSALRFFEVPQNERWFLDRYDVVFMASGAYTVSGVLVFRKIDGYANSIYFDLAAAQSVSYHSELRNTAILDPGDRIYINVDGYTSTAALRLYMDMEQEEIR